MDAPQILLVKCVNFFFQKETKFLREDKHGDRKGLFCLSLSSLILHHSVVHFRVFITCLMNAVQRNSAQKLLLSCHVIWERWDPVEKAHR